MHTQQRGYTLPTHYEHAKKKQKYMSTMKNLPATEKRLEQIKKLQRTDEACQLIATYLCSGWPDKRAAPVIVKPYL